MIGLGPLHPARDFVSYDRLDASHEVVSLY
jgi:hypothetical protein